ncbi:ATP-binding protein [uncultured Eubacterium sp.]|uniref:ATP-binding protein n=1 Tax=uncultured Eubacterium sp. TaxID=165185 RepID=UPI002597D546|nr:AAA family ATPase [uncultured Eubacterium sp.]
MYKRKIYDSLKKWKKDADGKSAVLIEGARRIGKSTVVEEFAKNEYKDYILIDFSTAEEAIKTNFDNISNIDVFFRNLFLLTKKRLEERSGVIIFDEVQFYPRARQMIKHLVKDGRYDYIETGSLISIKKNVKDILIPSEEECIKMYPMDFEEFLWANGDEVTMDVIRDAFEKKKPLGEDIHRKIMQEFRTYMAVGGMPQAVEAYVEGKDYRQIDRVKKNIINLYTSDLKKHDSEENDRADVIFKSLPEQLSNHNSIFKYSVIDKNARMVNCINAIDFLNESMIINNCVNVTSPEVTLELYADRSKFKMFMGDTGLLVSDIIKNSEDVDVIYRSLVIDKLGINQGMIFENMVAQMLRTKGYELYFHEFNYSKNKDTEGKKYEIDFLIVKGKRIVPIEVKSSSYKNHKSFDYFKEKYKIKMNDRYIIYTKDLTVEDGIVYIPIYMTYCI